MIKESEKKYRDFKPDLNEYSLAALSYAFVVISYFVTGVPFIIWLSSKDKGGFLASQTLQFIPNQICILVIWLNGFRCYFLLFVENIFSLEKERFASGDIAEMNCVSAFLLLFFGWNHHLTRLYI